jgi:hypothetical protein
MVIQWLRGREYRERIRQQREKLTLLEFKEYCKKKHPNELPDDFDRYVKLEWNKHLATAEQMTHLIDGKQIEELGLKLLNHIWVVGINRTMQPFYTSDNPVVKIPHLFKPGRSLSGFGSQGVEIVFPLTPTHILVLFERRHHYKANGHREDGVHLVNYLGVDRYNEWQVKQSYRQVFCTKKEFEQAQGVCRRFPEVCNPERNRVNVERRGDVIAILNEAF